MRVIDLADPGPEGPTIAETLRVAGFEVRERGVRALQEGSDAALIILAGDAPGAMDALGALRCAEGTRTAPIVVVGTPREGPFDAGGLAARGADAFYARPVASERLARKVETFFAPSAERLRSPAPPAFEPQAVSAPAEEGGAEPPASRPEPTIQLGRAEEDGWGGGAVAAIEEPGAASAPSSGSPGNVAPGAPAGEVSGVAGLSAVSGEPGAGPDALQVAPTAPGSALSTRLQELLRHADRRMFPELAPLEMRFPGGDEPPDELVPDELLASVAVPVEPMDEDPFDAFTFVGGVAEDGRVEPAVPPPVATPAQGGEAGEGDRAAESQGERSRDDPAAVSAVRSAGSAVATASGERSSRARDEGETGSSGGATADALDVGEPTTDGEGRCGELGCGEVIALLWTLYDRRVDVRLVLRPPGEAIEMRLREGQLVSLSGPVATRLWGMLQREGRVAEPASSEEAAWALLGRASAAGWLGSLEVERRLRHTREQLLHELVDAEPLTFELRPLSSSGHGRLPEAAPLVRDPLPAVLVEGARRRLPPPRVAGLVGEPQALELRLGAAMRRRAREARVPPELVAWLERHDGRTLAALLAEDTAEEGIAGLVLALAEIGALRLVDASETAAGSLGGRPVEAVRRAVQAAAERAREADYFSLLGVRPDAPARELRAAWLVRRRELLGLPLAACGLEGLEPARDLAVDALDEAWDILRNDRLKRAYAAALAAVGERC